MSLKTLDPDQLVASGAIFYNEKKSPTGERWAANVDNAAKSVHSTLGPVFGNNLVGLALLPTMAVGEFGARMAGRAWDAVKGAGHE
jgi:hypothetical protein